MAKLHTISKFVIGHVLAGAVIILGTLTVTLMCYILGLATAPHGIDTPYAVIPEFLMVMLMAGIFSVLVSTASFLISMLLNWLRSRKQFPIWLPVIIVPLATFLITYVMHGRDDFGFIFTASGLAFIYFGTYWTLLTTSGAFFDFLR